MTVVRVRLKQVMTLATLVVGCGALSGCGGGGGGGGGSTASSVASSAAAAVSNAAGTVTNAVGNAVSGAVGAVTDAMSAIGSGIASMLSPSTPATTTPVDPATAQLNKEIDASRLAKQATFGPTPAVVDRILSLGVSDWLDEQFATSSSSYADLAASPLELTDCYHSASCLRQNYGREQVAMRFYADALGQPDQLRQRVAFALSQRLVAANTSTNNPTAGLAAYQQILLDGAFGNYRDLMMKVTLNCYMGFYLNMHASHKIAPSENYAREFLQLFTMGPNRLNMDGSLMTDASGAALPNYTPDDVKGVARALTGWLCPQLNPSNTSSSFNMTQPMTAVVSRHDVGAKSFLGVTVPANSAPADEVAAVIDAAFNHASTPPFVARSLIQQLVTSNPSPAYIGRVAAVFVNDGNTVRGNLKAVVRAVLTDPEARATVAATTAGKVKEPVLLLTSLARAAGMASDGLPFTVRDQDLGQAVFQPASVFSFYPPDFPLPQNQSLVSPPSKLMTTATTISRSNVAYAWTIAADGTASEFATSSTVANAKGTTADWSGWEAFGSDTDSMIDRIDLVLMNRTLTATQKSALKTAAEAITSAATPALLARKRAQALLYIVLTSPLFQVDR